MRSIERGLLLILAVVAVADHLRPASAAPNDRSVAANEFVLLSDHGETVGAFRISPEGTPQLIMADKKGHGRLMIGLDPDGSAEVALTDVAGAYRARLISGADGSCQLQLADAGKSPRIVLRVDEKGATSVQLDSSKHKDLVTLAIDEHDVPTFSIGESDGSARVAYGVTAGGVVGLHLFDKSATMRAGLDLDGANTAYVFAQDAAGKGFVRFEAPSEAYPSLALKDKTGRKLPIK